MRKLRPLLVTIAATAAVAGGGAAIATAATSSTATSGGTTTTSTTPARTAPAAPGQGSGHAPPGRSGGSGSHNCPNM